MASSNFFGRVFSPERVTSNPGTDWPMFAWPSIAAARDDDRVVEPHDRRERYLLSLGGMRLRSRLSKVAQSSNSAPRKGRIMLRARQTGAKTPNCAPVPQSRTRLDGQRTAFTSSFSRTSFIIREIVLRSTLNSSAISA